MAVDINLLGSATSNDIKSCDTAIVFNNVDLGFEKINNLNYQTIITRVRESGEYDTLTKIVDESGEYYLFKYSSSKVKGFNNIVFLDSSNTVLGYYVYPKIQGTNLNCKIYVESKTIELESKLPYSGVLSGTLDDVAKSASTTIKNIGDNLFDYTSIEKVASESSIKKLYTQSILDLELNNKCIALNNNYLDKSNLYTINLGTDINIDAFNCNYTNFKIGYFLGDLVLYEWKDIKYKSETKEQRQYFNIISLTKTNKFGNPISYIKRAAPVNTDITRDKWSENEIYFGGDCTDRYNVSFQKSKLMYGSGRYLVGEVYSSKPIGENIKIFNTEKNLSESGSWCNDWEEDLSDYNVFLDEWSLDSKIYKINKIGSTLSYETAVTKCPELVNTFTNFKRFLDNNSASLTIIRKTGNWFLFRYNYSDNIRIFVLSGIYGDIYLSYEDLDKLIIINDNTILLKEENYYTVFHCHKTSYYSERARNIIDGGSLDTMKINGCDIIFNIVSKESQEIYKGYYKEGIIEIIPKTEELYKTSLNRYRKNSYPLDINGIPDIIGACNGLIFYLKNNKYINYL